MHISVITPERRTRKMTKSARFLAICLLVVSLFGSALADGGQTQGTDFVPPVPPPTCTIESVEPIAPTFHQDSPVDLATLVTLSITTLAEVIF
jgi:hypothetical protein